MACCLAHSLLKFAVFGLFCSISLGVLSGISAVYFCIISMWMGYLKAANRTFVYKCIFGNLVMNIITVVYFGGIGDGVCLVIVIHTVGIAIGVFIFGVCPSMPFTYRLSGS